MEVIKSYLENLFLNLPKTDEVLRAKEELAHMMEDKYNELLAKGKKQNEAIGIVISEFGDLEELAKELGLGDLYSTKQAEGFYVDEKKESPVMVIDRKTAEEYINVSALVSKWIAIGVMLCIISPTFLFICGGIDLQFKKLNDISYVVIGMIPLFLMIAVAVFLFIYFGMKMEKFEYLKKEKFVLDSAFERKLRETEEEERPKFAIKIASGVVLCILSVIPLFITGSSGWGDGYDCFSLVYLLVLVAAGVGCFIIGGMRMESLKVLLQEGDFVVSRKKSNKIIDTIAGVYWPIVTAVYLLWSFITGRWGYTWIIWPVAGIVFGAVAVLCEAIEKGKAK